MRRDRPWIAVAGVALAVAGLLAAGLGAIFLISIPRSDTATWSLMLSGLALLLPGLAAAWIGWRMLRGRRPRA